MVFLYIGMVVVPVAFCVPFLCEDYFKKEQPWPLAGILTSLIGMAASVSFLIMACANAFHLAYSVLWRLWHAEVFGDGSLAFWVFRM